jgi:hypothetical protein
MSDGVSSSSLAHYQQASHEYRSLQQATLRRKSAHLWDGAQGALSGYPSPPMSSPPSPTRRPSDLTLPSTRSEQFIPVSTNVPLASSVAERSSQQTTAPIASLGFTAPDVPAYHPTALFATGSGTATLGSATSAYPPTSYAPPPTIHQRTISQDARKAKTHVASACVNCKRAHLSCDVQRPCARCIASGKQVSGSSRCDSRWMLTFPRIHAMMSHTKREDDLVCVTKLNSGLNGRYLLRIRL